MNQAAVSLRRLPNSKFFFNQFITENGLKLVAEVSQILELIVEKQLCSDEKKDMEALIDCLKMMREAS